MTQKNNSTRKHSIRAHVSEFGMPPVHDALVIGRNAPIGCKAFRRALDLLVAAPFEHVEVEDGTVSDVLVRSSLLNRIPKERLVQFVLKEIKPLMTDTEVLHLDLEIRVTVEGHG